MYEQTDMCFFFLSAISSMHSKQIHAYKHDNTFMIFFTYIHHTVFFHLLCVHIRSNQTSPMHTCKSTMQRCMQIHTMKNVRLCAWSKLWRKKKHRICVFSLDGTVWGATPSTLSNQCVVVFFFWSTSAITEPTHSLFTFIMKEESSAQQRRSHTCMQELTETCTYMTTLCNDVLLLRTLHTNRTELNWTELNCVLNAKDSLTSSITGALIVLFRLHYVHLLSNVWTKNVPWNTNFPLSLFVFFFF